jgi:hypothetical protein
MNISADGQSAIRYLQCDGRDKVNLIKSILGYSVYEPPMRLHRFPPEAHPERGNLFARSAEFVRELGPPTPNGPFESLQFEWVELAFTYEATPGIKWLKDEFRPANYLVSDESWRYCHQVKEWAIEGRIIPKGILLFNKEAPPPYVPGIHLTVPEPGVVMQPSHTIRVVMKQVPVVYDIEGVARLPGKMEENWGLTVGRMNSLEFRGSPPQTLVCLAPSPELKTQPDGTDVFDITFTFAGRGETDVSGIAKELDTASGDWTRLLNASGTYSRVYRSSDPVNRAVSIYRAADFKRLFSLS